MSSNQNLHHHHKLLNLNDIVVDAAVTKIIKDRMQSCILINSYLELWMHQHKKMKSWPLILK